MWDVDLEKAHKSNANNAAYKYAYQKRSYGYHHTFYLHFSGVLGGIPLTSEFWETKFSACYNIRHLSYVETLTVGIRLPVEKQVPSSLIFTTFLPSVQYFHLFFFSGKFHAGKVF